MIIESMRERHTMAIYNFALAISLTLHLLLVNAIHIVEVPTQGDNVEISSGDFKSLSNLTQHVSLEVPEKPSGERDVKIFDFEFLLNGEKHPCQRTCTEGVTMTCKYDFVIEHSSVMNNACFDCPHNKSHCNMKYCIPGDGVKKPILVVNRQLPGPTINVCYGDTIEVKVTNEMLDMSTTIHWHGLLQKQSPFMDGVPFVSQCLILPQSSFLYKFLADTPGTQFWHSHSAFQRGDGIYGALVVRVSPQQNRHLHLYDYDLPEHTFTVSDWHYTSSTDKYTMHVHTGGDNQPSTILVNGKGRFNASQYDEKLSYIPVERFTVKKGYKYRFRLINAGFLNCPIKMSVDNHNITLIATDGEDITPLETVSLVSLAGERYDFVLNANQEVSNYWIRFKGLLDCKPKGAFQVAVLNYEGSSLEKIPEDPVTYENAERPGLQINNVNTPLGELNSVLVSELSSLPNSQVDPELKPIPDYKFYISYDFYAVDNRKIHYSPMYGYFKFPQKKRILTPQINHISMASLPFALMAEPQKRKYLEFCNATSVSLDCLYEYCECLHVIRVPLNAVVEIVLIDEGLPYDANHPFHLHGYKFRVVGSNRLGNSTTQQKVRELDRQGLLARNLKNPPNKDTVTTPDGGYSILRFHATNPGYWIFHCHIDFHMEMGMSLLFKIGNDETHKLPPHDFPKCGDYYPTFYSNKHRIQMASQFQSDDSNFYTIHKSTSANPASLNIFLFVILPSYMCIHK